MRSRIGASALISASNASGEAEGVASMPWSAILPSALGTLLMVVFLMANLAQAADFDHNKPAE